jgi:hypothetical protein
MKKKKRKHFKEESDVLLEKCKFHEERNIENEQEIVEYGLRATLD